MLVTSEMLSLYCKELKSKFKLSDNKCHKLIANLRNKESFITVNLQLHRGLHRVIRFNRSPCMVEAVH